MKTFLSVVLAIVLGAGILYGGSALSLHLYKTFATRWESARTDVYRNNKSYIEGTVRDLRNLRVEYEGASDAHKAALRTLILQRANELDWDRLPSDLRRFLDEL